MKCSALSALVALAALAASPVLADGAATVAATATPPSPAVAPPAARPKVDPMQTVVCKSEDVIGSRLGGKRICMTRAQWADQSRDGEDSVARAQRAH